MRSICREVRSLTAQVPRSCLFFRTPPLGSGKLLALIADVHSTSGAKGRCISRSDSNLLQGHGAAEIAELSGRAFKTVRNQIQTIYEKVGVTSNVKLIETLAVFCTVGEMFERDDGNIK